MANIFLISDTHFGHENTWKTFKGTDGITPLRPFSSTDEMNEYMVDNWNKVVRPKDKVYHLGDVYINKKYHYILSRLNGDKVLIKGNHDINGVEYLSDFRDIRAYHELDKYLLSHIPIHPNSKQRWRGNIHGHLHAYQVLGSDKHPDPWYFNVSVEQINYTPISFEEIKGRMAER